MLSNLGNLISNLTLNISLINSCKFMQILLSTFSAFCYYQSRHSMCWRGVCGSQQQHLRCGSRLQLQGGRCVSYLSCIYDSKTMSSQQCLQITFMIMVWWKDQKIWWGWFSLYASCIKYRFSVGKTLHCFFIGACMKGIPLLIELLQMTT